MTQVIYTYPLSSPTQFQYYVIHTEQPRFIPMNSKPHQQKREKNYQLGYAEHQNTQASNQDKEKIEILIKYNEQLRSIIKELYEQRDSDQFKIMQFQIENSHLKQSIEALQQSNNQFQKKNEQIKLNEVNLHQQISELQLLMNKKIETQNDSKQEKANEVEDKQIKLYEQIRKKKDQYEKEQISVEQFHEEIFQLVSPKLPITYLLGQAGVGKTFIMHKLFDDLMIREFQLELLADLKTYFVDTQAFDFQSNIDQREMQIQKHQKVFVTYPNKVASLLIVVNFERTDMMKNKFMAVYRYFKKFTNKISLIVTDFHLSQNPDSDEQHLREHFANYKLKDILFIGKQIVRRDLIEKLRLINPQQNQEQEYSFDLKDTLFEVENPEEITQAILRLQQQLQG